MEISTTSENQEVTFVKEADGDGGQEVEEVTLLSIQYLLLVGKDQPKEKAVLQIIVEM